jgi:hypothetical protein
VFPILNVYDQCLASIYQLPYGSYILNVLDVITLIMSGEMSKNDRVVLGYALCMLAGGQGYQRFEQILPENLWSRSNAPHLPLEGTGFESCAGHWCT